MTTPRPSGVLEAGASENGSEKGDDISLGPLEGQQAAVGVGRASQVPKCRGLSPGWAVWGCEMWEKEQSSIGKVAEPTWLPVLEEQGA